ncbi:MAG: mandelate racemase/muconate lactonizing enzyme family protein [Fuerstiella sp.]|nr:mandelate racemase/muconate lactonizing enzyme family protein [Fuerstiella sp.]
MKITDVRAIQPVAENSPPDWRTTMGQILVAVDTDGGVTGYGVGGGGAAGVHVVNTVLRDLLLGRNPESVEDLWREMYFSTLPFGCKGLAIMAISGVDLALWDIRGRVAGEPVAVLLGGNIGDSIPVYVTVWDTISAAQVAEFGAFKLHVKRIESDEDLRSIGELVDASRRTAGPDAKLMVDAWMQWDLPTTLAVIRMIEQYDVTWIEEPLPVDDLAGYETLVGQSKIPIAGGEHEFTAAGFRPLIERRLHQVLQPDVCWCGGMTQLVEIYRMASAAGLQVCPHRGAEVWALHAIAALDQNPLAESGRPWMTWVGGQSSIEQGSVTLSDAPGFGIVIDETSLPV